MSGLRPVPARDLLRVLAASGFSPVSQKGSHMKMRRADGRMVIVPMHASRPIKVGLLRAILRQADIEPAAFLRRL